MTLVTPGDRFGIIPGIGNECPLRVVTSIVSIHRESITPWVVQARLKPRCCRGHHRLNTTSAFEGQGFEQNLWVEISHL